LRADRGAYNKIEFDVGVLWPQFVPNANAVLALLPAQEWQDISTVPRDGTEVDLWVKSNNGAVNDRMAALAEKEKEWAQNIVAALKTAEKELTHAVPGSCYSTGPMTGDPIQDLVACPGCAALAKVRAAISSQKRGA